MKIVSVINYKGGVGKTTLSANLAAELARRGRKVLAVDLDPQASLTFSFIRPDVWQSQLADSRTIKRWFEAFGKKAPIDLAKVVVKPQPVNKDLPAKGTGMLHLIPSHLGLINVDLELATELGGASLKQSKLNYLSVHRRLLNGLADPNFQKYDLVVIDCPPNFNVVTKTAIVASGWILIPAKADYLSTLGIDYLRRSLDELVSNYNEYLALDRDIADEAINPQVLGVVFSMVQFYAGQPISALRPYISQTKRLGIPVFDAMFRENKTVFSDAPQVGVPVVLNDDSSKGYIVSEIRAFVDEFEKKLAL